MTKADICYSPSNYSLAGAIVVNQLITLMVSDNDIVTKEELRLEAGILVVTQH